MKVLGVTCARGGSKRIPNKNIRELAGKPLIAWTIQEALKSQYVNNNYIVSSDDDEIRKISISYGAVVLERPEELAQDNTPSILALQHAVKAMEERYGRYDIIADIRCTNPTKTVEDIDGMIEHLIYTQGENVIGIGPAYPIERIKRLDKQGRITDVIHEPSDGQSQFLPESWIRNGSCYVYWRDAVMQEDSTMAGQVESYGYKMPLERSVNIDTELDWAVATVLLKAREA